MNLEYLRSFYLIAHLHSVKEAAQRMQLSQPALSHQLQMLENSFSVQLIDRNTKPLQLTEAGKILLSRCQELFDWVEEVTGEVRSVQKEMAGHLRIAAPPGIGRWWLIPRLKAFQAAHPGIDIHTELLDLSKIQDRLEQHRADFVITVHPFQNPNFIFQTLFNEEMVLICHHTHSLCESSKLPYDHFINAQWILFSEEDLSPQLWLKRQFGKVSGRIRPHFFVNDHACMMELLKEGRHIAILPRQLVESELHSREFVELNPSKSRALTNQVYAAYRARKQIPAKIQALLKLLKE